MSVETGRFLPVAKAADVVLNEPLQVRIGSKVLALYRLADDRICATDGICSHEHAYLAQGFQDGEEIECPLHQARFNIRTGKALSPPAERDIATYRVCVEGDQVLVELPSLPSGN